MEQKIVDMIFKFEVPLENQDRYSEVLAEQLEIASKEPGTLIYEVFRTDDGSYCQHERYADEQACVIHCENTASQLSEWMELTNITQLIALGPLSQEFRNQFGIDTNYLPYANGKK